jgi:2',3'-cyclic-nucleotide 2'-phosphodiesterase (5'-nucleotidase family)
LALSPSLSLKACFQPVRLRSWDPVCDEAQVPATFHQDQGDKHSRAIDKEETYANNESTTLRDQDSEKVASKDVCSFVADAIFADIPVFDVVLLNNGMCNSEIPKGVFKEEDDLKLLPYNNELVALRITGKDMVYAIEQGIDGALQGNNGAAPKTAGIRYDLDYTQHRWKRVANVEVMSHFCTWEPLDGKRRYTVLTNTYLARGGDGYSILSLNRRTISTGVSEADSLWFHAQSTCVLETPGKRQMDVEAETAATMKMVYMLGDIQNSNMTLMSSIS